jgi:cytochrome c peroxidase
MQLNRRTALAIAGWSAAVLLALLLFPQTTITRASPSLDGRLTSVLAAQGFTGRIQSTLERRLRRPLTPQLADIGRLLWFDTITGLNNDNTCAGCHSPTNGFGDSQPIAIGIENNGVVGPHRTGPRNMRHTPMAINTAFFPKLMWNSRFASLSGDPFTNAAGFLFPDPEGLSLSSQPHLLDAQAFIPPTERTEAAGFAFHGDNTAIRAEVIRRLNAVPEYRRLFGKAFPSVGRGGDITYDMFARAIAEFEFSLTYADAPIDRFARGDQNAMPSEEKQGALLFFGKAGCVACHAVGGRSNEMFSDFKDHAVGIPQIVPRVTNNQFDGAGANQDFGREEISGNPQDRYAFRTAPLRNVALEAAYMHDGAFTNLDDAIRYHLDALSSARSYSPSSQHLPADLTGPIGPLQPVLAHLDPLLATPVRLSHGEVKQLVAFVRDGLLDPRATPQHLRSLVPETVPSGRQTLAFEFPPDGNSMNISPPTDTSTHAQSFLGMSRHSPLYKYLLNLP